MVDKLAPYQVTAFNSARDSENRMHDDAVAKSLGFAAGLVPGVDLIAYLSHLPVGLWGEEFLTGGELSARFLKPVYEADLVTINGTVDGDSIALTAETRGEICVKGTAARRGTAVSWDIARYAAISACVEADRPVFGEASLLPGSLLRTRGHVFTPESHAQHLDSVSEADPLYAAARIVHPGSLSRVMNYALSHNLRLGPWIHTSARLRFVATAHVGDELTALAEVLTSEPKGDRQKIVLDGLIIKDGKVPIAYIEHTTYIPH
jgi:acyl-coenzyme A thioesterase PaaI-like protein